MGDHKEKIMCVSEDILFREGKWNGLITDNLDSYLKTIKENYEFRPRCDLENDSSYKQIIGEVVLKYKDKYFLHKQVNRGEERLNSFCPLPLGGHIEEFDKIPNKDIVEVALDRELEEEAYVGSKIISKDFLGLVYLEDDNPVNHVHVGLVYVYELDGMDVHIKEEGLEDIGFVSLDYLKTNKETLTYWSRVIIYHL